jgi:hypothetical protein
MVMEQITIPFRVKDTIFCLHTYNLVLKKFSQDVKVYNQLEENSIIKLIFSFLFFFFKYA